MISFSKYSAVLALVAVSMLAPQSGQPRPMRATTASMAEPSRATVLQAAMRKLWEDHITWTRVWIIDAVAGLPDKDAAAQRLLRNQVDIGDAIKPYYGAAAGNKLTALLTDHILIATKVVEAAKAGDSQKVAAEQARWSANADDIATFLSGANPSWQRGAIRDMLQKHLDYTTEEAVDRLHGDWAADIRAYDANHVHMLMFADMLSSGIEQQFPRQFGG